MNNNTCCNMMQQRNADRSYPYRQIRSEFPECVAVAMAYVPIQLDTELYSCDKGLMQGTMFPVLDKPFVMGCCR